MVVYFRQFSQTAGLSGMNELCQSESSSVIYLDMRTLQEQVTTLYDVGTSKYTLEN